MNLKYDIKKKSHPLLPQKLEITDDKWEKIVKKFIKNGSIHYPSSSFQSFHFNEDPIITIKNIRNSFLNNKYKNNHNSKNKKNNKNNNNNNNNNKKNNNNNNNDIKQSKLPKISYLTKEKEDKYLKMSLVGGGGVGSKTGFVIQFVQDHLLKNMIPLLVLFLYQIYKKFIKINLIIKYKVY